MRNALVILAMAVLVRAAWGEETKTVTVADAPRIEFTEKEHDFGTIPQFTANEYLFKFKNTGTATLKIAEVKAACGCTAALATENTVEPGKTGEIKVTFNSQDFNGEVHKSLTVFSNDPEHKETVLQIKANVLADVACSKMRLEFGDLSDPNMPKQQDLKVFSPSNKKFKVTSAAPSAEYIKTEIVPGEKENEYVIHVRIAGNPPAGSFVANIALQTDIGKAKPLSITVAGSMPSRTEVIPPKLFFGVVCSGTTPSRDLTVKAHTWDGLKIESVDAPPTLAVTTKEVKPGKEWLVTVQLKEGAKAAGASSSSMLKEKIKLNLNDPTMKQVEVIVYAMMRECKDDEGKK